MASAGSTLGTKKDSPDDQHHFLDTKQFAGVEGNKGELKRPEPGSYRPPSRLGTFSARRGLSADAVRQPPSSRVLEWLQALLTKPGVPLELQSGMLSSRARRIDKSNRRAL